MADTSAVAGIPVAALDPDSVDAGAIAHYGDPMGEQRLLAHEVGLVDRSHRGVLAVPGEDRLTWLHNLTTQHLTALHPFEGTELLVLSPHGHVEHHAVLADDGTTAWLDTEPSAAAGGSAAVGGAAAALLDFLNRMRFLMRVEPAEVTADWALLSLVGPKAAIPGLALPPPRIEPVPGAKFASADVAARPSTVYSVASRPGGPGWVRRMPYGYDLLVPRDRKAEVVAELGAPPAGIWAFEALRVAARRPRLGFETDHRTLPAEVGWLAGAVHLDKGCYRGQETVARVHNLGRPPRRLVLLHLDGIATDEPPAQGTAVSTVDGRQVGFVGTAVRHFELGMIALAVLKRSVPDDAHLRVGESAAAIDPEL